MEMYFFQPEEWDRIYLNGCRHYDIDIHPIEERRHMKIGWSFIFLFVFYQSLYIPCLFAIWKHTKQSCYKLIFFIGITDCLCLFVNAFFTGYFSITGQVFCSNPHLNYWVGLTGTFLWVIESSADLILAFNRCVEVTSPNVGDLLFKGNRTWYWLIPVSLYSLYFSYFTKPVTFSGLFVCYFFNPHAGYIEDFGESTYHNNLHSFHNMLIFFGVSGLYVVFVAVMVTKFFTFRGISTLSLAQRMTFFQVLAISFFNGYAAGLYVYLQFVRVTQFLMYTATYSWTTAHGLPGLIYIALNKTIRDDCIRMFKGKFKLNDKHSSTSNARISTSNARITPAITRTSVAELENTKE
ncbi:serpentine type 7TM GPCR chemoreceptor srt domain-containing protein [Ditylenchus destructor]|uniref:Serpentine type 7TM GPCR chemoreceptor srt domain-containing protein n=1 Tax=Ditylenchus destructor TaxID=166010 RepID=A0AAD4MZL8_9BILA|nr:serpentine type 7TM GPCR chemoreceptor srt domain-containing protein [Ditylenchus destructor]